MNKDHIWNIIFLPANKTHIQVHFHTQEYILKEICMHMFFSTMFFQHEQQVRIHFLHELHERNVTFCIIVC